mmetsp:Transcript_69498/g.137452  ORF Transcript_69498/g.137452 Transcript_69498/m.137452 type:complete len:267 (-) Transcript_69498:61-861(-)
MNRLLPRRRAIFASLILTGIGTKPQFVAFVTFSATTVLRWSSDFSSQQVVPRMAMAGQAAVSPSIVLDPFAKKNFVEPGKDATGRAFIHFDMQEFERRVNEFYTAQLAAGQDPLQPGYAPFCKHLFVPNFVPGLPDGALRITDENRGLLRSAYIARTDKELPVLTRWFAKAEVAGQVPEAKILDVILYSREQIRKENEAMAEDSNSDAPWGIVSVKPQSIDSEIPMEPITMMRNCLGTEHGGSGVALDKEAYALSVEFWAEHAQVK